MMNKIFRSVLISLFIGLVAVGSFPIQSYGAFSKPYTIDAGPTGDTVKEGVDKLEDNVDDIYVRLNSLKNAFISTTAPTSPDTGQIWGDSNYAPVIYKYYSGSVWVPLVQSFPLVNSLPQGYMLNGKITTAISSNDLVVSIKNLAGNDPSATDPVFIRIGNTVRTISAALSVTFADATNWFNLGVSEFATIEQDLFVYLGYRASDTSVFIGVSRIPYGRIYSEFNATNTDGKYLGYSGSAPAATDEVEVVGRFNAILGVSATFIWSLPATSIIINRPIYETRYLTYTPTVGGFSGTPTVAGYYHIIGRQMTFYINISGESNATNFTFTSPLKVSNEGALPARIMDNGGANYSTTPGMAYFTDGSLTHTVYSNWNGAAWTASGVKALHNTQFVVDVGP